MGTLRPTNMQHLGETLVPRNRRVGLPLPGRQGGSPMPRTYPRSRVRQHWPTPPHRETGTDTGRHRRTPKDAYWRAHLTTHLRTLECVSVGDACPLSHLLVCPEAHATACGQHMPTCRGDVGWQGTRKGHAGKKKGKLGRIKSRVSGCNPPSFLC